jgi:hypothetical protein
MKMVERNAKRNGSVLQHAAVVWSLLVWSFSSMYAQKTTIPLGDTPRGLALTEEHVLVTVGGFFPPALVVISRTGDAVLDEVHPVTAIAYRDIAYDSSAHRLYMGFLGEPFGDDELVVLDAGSFEPLDTMSIGGAITVVKANPLNHKLYVGRINPNLVHVINTETGGVVDVEMFGQPMSIVIGSWNDAVVGTSDGVVAVIDGESDELAEYVSLGGEVVDIALHETANRLYAVGGGRYHSLEFGTSLPLRPLLTLWTLGYLNGIAVNEQSGLIYASEHDGGGSDDVIRVIEPGTFRLIGEMPSPFLPYLYLEICVSSDRLYVANVGDNSISVYEPFQTGVDASQPYPAGYELLPNYPNPFNGGTVIPYRLPATALVRIELWNLLGENIRVLVDEVQSGGTHEVAMRADGIPSGVYVYRLASEGQIFSRRMLLLK